MIIRKVFRSGGSQVISIPPDSGIKLGDYVKVTRDDGKIIIEPLEVS